MASTYTADNYSDGAKWWSALMSDTFKSLQLVMPGGPRAARHHCLPGPRGTAWLSMTQSGRFRAELPIENHAVPR